VIHLTDGLDVQYNILKEQVEKMRLAGKRNHDYKNKNVCVKNSINSQSNINWL